MMPHRFNILPRIFIFVKKKWLFIIGEILLLNLIFSLGFIVGSKIFLRPPLIIDKELLIDLNENTTKTTNINTSQAKLFVASSKGKYYYPLDCSLAQNLKEENKIYFSSKEEAEKSGYIYNEKCEN